MYDDKVSAFISTLRDLCSNRCYFAAVKLFYDELERSPDPRAVWRALDPSLARDLRDFSLGALLVEAFARKEGFLLPSLDLATYQDRAIKILGYSNIPDASRKALRWLVDKA